MRILYRRYAQKSSIQRNPAYEQYEHELIAAEDDGFKRQHGADLNFPDANQQLDYHPPLEDRADVVMFGVLRRDPSGSARQMDLTTVSEEEYATIAKYLPPFARHTDVLSWEDRRGWVTRWGDGRQDEAMLQTEPEVVGSVGESVGIACKDSDDMHCDSEKKSIHDGATDVQVGVSAALG